MLHEIKCKGKESIYFPQTNYWNSTIFKIKYKNNNWINRILKFQENSVPVQTTELVLRLIGFKRNHFLFIQLWFIEYGTAQLRELHLFIKPMNLLVFTYSC